METHWRKPGTNLRVTSVVKHSEIARILGWVESELPADIQKRFDDGDRFIRWYRRGESRKARWARIRAILFRDEILADL